jgi:hypothetical protein
MQVRTAPQVKIWLFFFGEWIINASYAALFLPFVFDLSEESRTHDRIGLFDVGERHAPKEPLHFESAILVNGTDFLRLIDDQELLAIAHDLHRVLCILSVVPFTQELRSMRCASCDDENPKQAKSCEARNE